MASDKPTAQTIEMASADDVIRGLGAADPVIDGDVDVGFVVPQDIEIHAIEGDAEHGYFYTQDRVYFVNMSDRTVVYSPGTVVAVEGN
ncbi:MAG: DUF1236 domain-containing protein [Proteobacteria bacterium]|nr:MAG: DUF1236 domain-containing protein [Pseudomonadota bacterium]